MRPSLLASSPQEEITNGDRVWFTFELSESILFLHNPSLSVIDNVRLVTKKRLLSMICSIGSSGDCIDVNNGEVEDATVASDRYDVYNFFHCSFSLLVRAIANGPMSVRVPHKLITDLAGNELAGDLTESIVVEKVVISVSWSAVAVTLDKVMKPILVMEFNKQVQISGSESSQSIIVTHPRINSPSIVVTLIIPHLQISKTDLILRNEQIRFPLSSSFEFHNSYSIRIPSGLIRDSVNNYYRGCVDEEIIIPSYSMQPLAILNQMNQSSFIFVILPLIVGIYVSALGYRNLYYSVIFVNASLFLFILYYILISVIFEEFQKSNVLWRSIVELVCVVVSLLLSHLLLRYAAKFAMHFFVGNVCWLASNWFVRLITDIIVMKVKYLLMYVLFLEFTNRSVFYILIGITIIFGIFGCWISLNTQTQYLLIVSAAGAGLVVEAITAIIRWSLQSSYRVYGAPLGLIWDSLCIICNCLLFVLIYRFQKHV